MNIGYVLADFPVFSETFVGDEMRAMQARGHKIVPIVLRPQSEPGQEADRELASSAYRLADIPTQTALSAATGVGARVLPALDFVRKQKLLPRTSLLANALKIAGVAKHHGCSHLHAHFSGGAAAHAIVAARAIGASVSFICHGHDVYSEPEDLPLKLHAANFVIATCADMAADLRKMAPGAKIVLSYCGVGLEKFPLRVTPQTNGKLLFIGRLFPQKGVDDIIAALASLSPDERMPLDIVGDGPQRPALEMLAREKGLLESSVRFLGAKPRSWFAENGADYAALAAPFKTGPKGERDSGPTVIKEAMAMGLPVIASRYMGVKEMVVPGTGLLMEPGDVAGLAKSIAQVRSWTNEHRAEVIAKARTHMEAGFSLENQAAELSAFIEAAQEQSGSKARQIKLKLGTNQLSTFYGKYFHRT